MLGHIHQVTFFPPITWTRIGIMVVFLVFVCSKYTLKCVSRTNIVTPLWSVSLWSNGYIWLIRKQSAGDPFDLERREASIEMSRDDWCLNLKNSKGRFSQKYKMQHSSYRGNGGVLFPPKSENKGHKMTGNESLTVSFCPTIEEKGYESGWSRRCWGQSLILPDSKSQWRTAVSCSRRFTPTLCSFASHLY